MTKIEYISEVILPQFNEDGDRIVIENGGVKFFKLSDDKETSILISELTSDGEYREYYALSKPKRKKK